VLPHQDLLLIEVMIKAVAMALHIAVGLKVDSFG
jgi:hypothetical protein